MERIPERPLEPPTHDDSPIGTCVCCHEAIFDEALDLGGGVLLCGECIAFMAEGYEGGLHYLAQLLDCEYRAKEDYN